MKDFAAPSYIYRTSNQPKKYFDNIPMSTFHRLKRISSSNATYQEASKKITSHLILRGYSNLECFAAQKRVNERQMLSAFAASGENSVKRQEIKRSYDTFNLNARYNPRTNWKEAQDCVTKIHDSIYKHYVNSKNKSTLLSQRKSKIVFSDRGPNRSGVNNRKLKHGF